VKFRHAGLSGAFLIATLGNLAVNAQVRVLHVDPQQTDSSIEEVQGPHVALYDPQVASSHRLFVFLVGTNGKAEGSLAIDRAFAKWGYHAIGLDYEDKVVAVSCAHSADSACFDNYRNAIVTGAPVSDKIKIDSANSILNRLQKLLAYLVKQDPEGGWDEFVADGQPTWSSLVIAGHSQGSGHAAYIGKLYAVDRVLMFSGPQDYLDDLDKPAHWQARPSATPPSRFFAFLNLKDPFNEQHQIANCIVLMGLSKPDTAIVEPGEIIHGNPQILINNIDTKRPHGSTLLPDFENVWKYMSTANIR
jgi:hypothetical protein